MAIRLVYFHDPMCSWCWGFAPVWRELQNVLPEKIKVELVVGGLAPDSDVLMPVELQQKLQGIWQRIEQVVPGTQFNFDFWTDCKPRRSTYLACRAVLAVKELVPEKEQHMISAIQQAYYLQAKNPSDLETLTQLAVSLGVEKQQFVGLIASPEIEQDLQQQIAHYIEAPVEGFPSLLLEKGSERISIKIDYNNVDNMLSQLNVS